MQENEACVTATTLNEQVLVLMDCTLELISLHLDTSFRLDKEHGLSGRHRYVCLGQHL